MEHDTVTRQNIAIDQVQRLTAQSTLGISATALNSTILAIILLWVLPRQRVLVWLGIVLIVCIGRLLMQFYFKRHPLTIESVGTRKRILTVSLAFSGGLWGAVPIYLFPESSLAHQVVITFVLGGMVAGSVGVFASLLGSFFAFSLPTMMPLIAVFLLYGDKFHLAMAAMLILFSVFMFTAARRLNREIYDFLTAKHEKISLIANLEAEIGQRQRTQNELLIKNQQIESIVDERTAELRQVNDQLRLEIDDRIEAEMALRESEQKYRELANFLPQIVFEADSQGILLFANRNMTKVLGFSTEDIQRGVSVFQLLSFESSKTLHDRFPNLLDGEKLDGFEAMACTREGRTFPVEIHSTPVVESNRTVGMRGIMIDLTEKKQAEEAERKLTQQLQRAQKMEMLGTLAGGVAHDLNNILSGIVSYPDLLLLQLPKESALRQPIRIMQDSGNKAAAIVQDLLTLTRRGVVANDVLCLNEIVRQYLNSPEHQKLMLFHPAVRVETTLEDDLLKVAGSKVHLMKSLMNLVSNAADAMPSEGGGAIDIRTSQCFLERPLKGYSRIVPGEYVVLTVKDDGVGIASSDLDHIFEPFFTKKRMGHSGTGLGMAVVWGTVKDHQAYIDVDSIEGQGTRFSLYFPVSRQPLPPSDTVDQAETLDNCQGRGETVLVVDDLEQQRQIASELLTQLGYRVTAVASGEDAIGYLGKNRVDGIVLDMIMDPGMDGLDTFKQILTLHPKQKAVIASGFSQTERVNAAIRLGAGPYIKKPYTLYTLGQAVRAALDSAHPEMANLPDIGVARKI